MNRLSALFLRATPVLALLYLALLAAILLYPFDFHMPSGKSRNGVSWPADGTGVRFSKNGMLLSAEPPRDLARRLVSGKGLTLEVWFSTASPDQDGPARIVSFSLNPWERNFTLAQEERDVVMRLRTTGTSENGTPGVDARDAIVPGQRQHVVVTFDFAEERIYVDGTLRIASTGPRGRFDTWNPSLFLVFGNEYSADRPWDGTIAYTAIYDRPLSAEAVAARHASGFQSAAAPAGLLAEYDFTQGPDGAALGGAPADAAPLTPRLTRPERVGPAHLFFSYFDGRLILSEVTPWDLTRNVILFLPFGVVFFPIFATRVASARLAFVLTVLGGALVSGTFEALQYFLPVRTSSLFDLGTNTLGALLGGLACWYGVRRGWLMKPVRGW